VIRFVCMAMYAIRLFRFARLCVSVTSCAIGLCKACKQLVSSCPELLHRAPARMSEIPHACECFVNPQYTEHILLRIYTNISV
jgi:hypothetical protein